MISLHHCVTDTIGRWGESGYCYTFFSSCCIAIVASFPLVTIVVTCKFIVNRPVPVRRKKENDTVFPCSMASYIFLLPLQTWFQWPVDWNVPRFIWGTHTEQKMASPLALKAGQQGEPGRTERIFLLFFLLLPSAFPFKKFFLFLFFLVRVQLYAHKRGKWHGRAGRTSKCLCP
jgi:hypothetical protein